MKEEKEGGRRGEEKRKEDERHSFLCSKHSSKCCTYINSFNSYNTPVIGPICISIL